MQRDRREKVTVLSELGEDVSGALSGGAIGFAPGEIGVEDVDLSGDLGEDGVASVGGGRRGDLVVVVVVVVVEVLVELTLLAFPLWKALILTVIVSNIILHGKKTKEMV